MGQRIRMLTIGTIVFILVSIITTATAIHYYEEYLSANERYTSLRGSIIQISVTIDYKNGTSTTDDEIYLSTDANVLDALRLVAKVNTTYWEAYQSFAVDGINDVFNDFTQQRMWIYEVNEEYALLSADHYILEDGDSIEWKYDQY